jgi:hypothetical protein
MGEFFSAVPTTASPFSNCDEALLAGQCTLWLWYDHVTRRLNWWAWIELHKLDAEKRPEEFSDGIPYHTDLVFLENFQAPDTWDYADDQIPMWYREWEQYQNQHQKQNQLGWGFN